MEWESRGTVRSLPTGVIVLIGIVVAVAGFLVLGLSRGWFNADDYGETIHPSGAIFTFAVPKHFVKGGFGGGRRSSYRGPPEGPDFTYVSALNGGGPVTQTSNWEEITVEVVHDQSEAAGQRLVRAVERVAKAEVRGTGGAVAGFRLLSVDGRPAVQWTAQTRTVSGLPLGQQKTYIRHGADAAVVTCQWRLDNGHQTRVEQGCRYVLQTIRLSN